MDNMKYLPPLTESLDGNWKMGNVISDAQLSLLTKEGKYLERILRSTDAFFSLSSLSFGIFLL